MENPALSTQAIKQPYYQNRYKFNGIEFDTAFSFNKYEARYRDYDPEIGRWIQIDPKPNYGESLYTSMGNNPILNSDPLGDTLVFPKGSEKFMKTTAKAIIGMVNKGVGQKIANIAAGKEKVNVVQINSKDKKGDRYDSKSNTIYWNPKEGTVTTNGTKLSAATALEHEADHAN